MLGLPSHLLTLAVTPPGSTTMDPAAVVLGATGPVFLVLWTLVGMALLSWVVIGIKMRQLHRWRRTQTALLRDLGGSLGIADIVQRCQRHRGAPGATVLLAITSYRGDSELLSAVAERELGEQHRRTFSLMTALSTIGASAPFIGLLGTVYGIMDAFLRIGHQKSAALPVVAPAIGEALIATAVGLFAAIPAVIAYNVLGRSLQNFNDTLAGATRVWVAQVPRLDPGRTALRG